MLEDEMVELQIKYNKAGITMAERSSIRGLRLALQRNVNALLSKAVALTNTEVKITAGMVNDHLTCVQRFEHSPLSTSITLTEK